MRLKKLLLALLVFTANLVGAQDLWIQRDSLNGPERTNAVAFTLFNDGYVVSGYDGFNRKRSMVSYDYVQDDWDDEESLGGASGDGLNRSSAVSFSCDGFGFVSMGEGNGFVFSDLWMYDPYTTTWSQMANFPGAARTQAVGFDIDNIGYVGLGKASDFATLLNDFWSYDYVSNSWTQIADFPGTPRMDAIGQRMGGKAYVGLGRDSSSFPVDFYEYYPVDDSWIQKANFPGTPRINAVSLARFPQLYVTTGDDGFNYLNDNWEYNYFGDVWQQRTDFPGAPRSGCISFEVQNRYFVGAGYGDGIYYDDFYEYQFVLSSGYQDIIDINLFPNPSNGKFSIQSSSIQPDTEIKIFDAQGRAVDPIIDQQNNQINVTLSDIPSGIYSIVLISNEQLYTRILSVQH